MKPGEMVYWLSKDFIILSGTIVQLTSFDSLFQYTNYPNSETELIRVERDGKIYILSPYEVFASESECAEKWIWKMSVKQNEIAKRINCLKQYLKEDNAHNDSE